MNKPKKVIPQIKKNPIDWIKKKKKDSASQHSANDAIVQMEEDEMIRCENLVKLYKTEDVEVMALSGLDLIVKKGDMMAIIGNSGSGKSTFLNMIGGLAKPTAGKLYVDGKDLFQMTETELVKYKQSTVGFVWQNHARNLFPYLTAQQNVEMPMLFASKEECSKRALELLTMVGMDHRKNSRLSQLSGGEQQRIAIAIALANNPKILLADEPTGAVDVKTATQILQVFRKLNEELGLTIVIVTHDPSLAKRVNRVVRIRDGKISSEQLVKTDFAKKLSEIGSLEDTEEETHEEFSVVDRNGRVQLSQEQLDALGIDGRYVRISQEGDKIIITK